VSDQVHMPGSRAVLCRGKTARSHEGTPDPAWRLAPSSVEREQDMRWWPRITGVCFPVKVGDRCGF
jgi:hypothetical protein